MPANPTILKTDRLLLRPVAPADLDGYAPIFADPEVMRFIGDGSVRTPERVARSVERSAELFASRGLGIFLVTDRKSGEILGDCFVVPVVCSEGRGAPEQPEWELGYRLKRSAWGRGIATEAARAVAAYALDPAGGGLEEVIGVAYPENEASQRVLLKIGMEPAGLTDRFYGMETALFVKRRPE